MKNSDQLFADTLPDFIARMPPSSHSGFALPDATLALLRELVLQHDIRRVFEFGSGRSTALFLELGCEVVSLEDSQHWLEQTIQTIPENHRAKLHAVSLPLETVWHQGAPFRSWKLSDDLRQRLQNAELILIDSPAFPPSREHPLILSLMQAANAITVIDDANIPTVRRFCKAIAENNPTLLTCFTEKDHGLCFFFRNGSPAPVRVARGILETGKSWRRFRMAKKTG